MAGKESFFVDTRPDTIAIANDAKEASHQPPPKAAWTDAESALIVPQQGSAILKKLQEPNAPSQTCSEYEEKLRQQYQKLHPQPEWAHSLLHRGVNVDTPEARLMSDIQKDLQKIARLGFHDRSSKSVMIKNGFVHMKRMHDIKTASQQVTSVNFHPTTNMVMATSGKSKAAKSAVCAYKYHAKEQPKLVRKTTIHEFPFIKQAVYTSDGQDAFICGANKPFYYTQRVETGQTERRCIVSLSGASGDSSMHLERVIIDQSNQLAAFGSYQGKVHIVSRQHGHRVSSLCMNSASDRQDSVALAAFYRPNMVMTSNSDRQLYVWDLRRTDLPICTHIHRLDDILTSLTCHEDRIVCGFQSGIVQLYNYNGSAESFIAEKTLMNLTTEIEQVQLASEWLIMSSSIKRDAIRLVSMRHAPCVMSNWPKPSIEPLGHVHSSHMSPDGRYLAVGNHQGIVKTFHIKQ